MLSHFLGYHVIVIAGEVRQRGNGLSASVSYNEGGVKGLL